MATLEDAFYHALMRALSEQGRTPRRSDGANEDSDEERYSCKKYLAS